MTAGIASLDGMQSYLLPIFTLFKHPGVAISLAIIMLALAAAFAVVFILRDMLPAERALDRVRARLNEIADHASFATEFATVDEIITDEKLFKHTWAEFKETLITEEVGIRNTARPATYFDVGSVSSELRLSRYQALPNYFVGFGLLFTFLGLVAAIHFASEGVAGDVSQAKQSLGDLLTAATFKFSTSIAGLASSLGLSIVIRTFISRLQHKFEEVCSLLEQNMTFVTHEGLMLQQISELKAQTLQLERFNTDFAVELAKALEARLNASLGGVIGDAVKPMASAIEGMVKNFGEMNQGAMSKIVGEFKNSIQGAAGTEITALAGTMQEMQRTLTTTIESMNQGSGTFGLRLEASVGRLEDVMGTASDALKRNTETVSSELARSINGIAEDFRTNISTLAENWKTNLSGSADAFSGTMDKAGATLAGKVDATTERLGEVLVPFANRLGSIEKTLDTLDGRFKAQIGEFDGSLARLTQFIGRMDESLNRLRDAGAPIAQTADKFASAASQIELTSATIREGQASLVELSNSIRDIAQTLNESWDSYRTRFEKVDEDLSSTFERLQTGTTAYHHQILDYVSQVDGHFNTSLQLLGGGIEQLKESVEELVEATARPQSFTPVAE